jgi:2-polyprenyl-3-methyl-5-hydroxy-6-metoxy-1,4-benzoquinol methylase
MRLSKREDWEVIHGNHGADRDWTAPTETVTPVRRRRLGPAVKWLIGPSLVGRMSSYEEYLLWQVLFKRWLTDIRPGAKVLEVGSAPGEFLVRFAATYGCVPYGVDYSETGVALNRQLFEAHGLDPRNVIHADFFSEDLIERYRLAFDVVISRGFIEHFDDVDAVLERHLSLLVEGGHLIVSIPNFTWVNKLLLGLFSRELLASHNFDVMRKERFAALFRRPGVAPLYCGYTGTFNFHLVVTGKVSRLGRLLGLCCALQPVLNLVFRAVLKERGLESRFFSPALVFIGRKVALSQETESYAGHRV